MAQNPSQRLEYYLFKASYLAGKNSCSDWRSFATSDCLQDPNPPLWRPPSSLYNGGLSKQRIRAWKSHVFPPEWALASLLRRPGLSSHRQHYYIRQLHLSWGHAYAEGPVMSCHVPSLPCPALSFPVLGRKGMDENDYIRDALDRFRLRLRKKYIYFWRIINRNRSNLHSYSYLFNIYRNENGSSVLSCLVLYYPALPLFYSVVTLPNLKLLYPSYI